MEPDNHAHWEALAARHGTGHDAYYDLERVVAGGSLMSDHEVAAVSRATRGAGVAGLDVMHLQSHLGADAVVMARGGARVTAVDFSATALARARDLAARCGVALETVEADSRALPESLAGRFDLVYATIGVLCWIDDVGAWMASAARALRPGGALALVELHPLLTAIDSLEPLVLDFPYGFDGPHVYSGTGSYAGVETEPWTTVQFAHSVGEVATAAIGAGLVVEHLEEHLSLAFDPRDVGAPLEADGRYRLRLGAGSPSDPAVPGVPLPVLYTLVARRP